MTRQNLKRRFESEIEDAVSRLKKYRPEKIILYGSVARGDFDENSDIDFLIIKKGVQKKRMVDRRLALDRYLKFGGYVEAVVFTSREIEQRLKDNDYFLADALKEGKVLYER